ncbi:MAG: radical SAM protein, partial [Phycisphaerae bacterium]|nr:radical SAM protein [Phycisphaerae bacterium]
MNGTGAQFPPLRILFWESTTRCNLNCIHCRRVPTGDDELSTAEFRTVLDSAAALGEPLIIFSGGEPLIRDDWEELSAFAKSLGFPTALATNGTLIDTDMARRIAAGQFHRVAVSLDGADPETHDSFRGLAGAFDRAVAGVSALRSEGVP